MSVKKDDIWTTDVINLLIDKRIARDAIFKQTNSDKLGWFQVVSDMRKEGGPKNLNRIIVRKQWTKICEAYNKCVDENNIDNSLAHQKLDNFFKKNHPVNKPETITQEYRNNISSRLLNTSSYAERWTVEKTAGLINSRISRNYLFEGKRSASIAWRTVAEDIYPKDLIVLTPSIIQQVRKKWENLITRYKNLKDTPACHDWPHFGILHKFFTEVRQIRQRTIKSVKKGTKESNNANRWTITRTKHLIARRVARSTLFKRGLSSVGWHLILDDLIALGAPKNLTQNHVRKKWENLVTRYRVIRKSRIESPTWPYYKEMQEFEENKTLNPNMNADAVENESEYYIEMLPEDISALESANNAEATLINCRLCQQKKGEYSLIEDKELCDKIVECTAINISENIAQMPSLICETCKISVEKFYEFLSNCREVDKKLAANSFPLEINNANVNEENVQICSYECPECPASFTCLQAFDGHVRSHKQSIKYCCEICSMEFNKQSSLQAHIKQHFEPVVFQPPEIEYVITSNADENDFTAEEVAGTSSDNLDGFIEMYIELI